MGSTWSSSANPASKCSLRLPSRQYDVRECDWKYLSDRPRGHAPVSRCVWLGLSFCYLWDYRRGEFIFHIKLYYQNSSSLLKIIFVSRFSNIFKDSLQKVNPEKRVVIWLRNYFDELGFDSENMEKVMKDYVTGIKLMLPLVFLNLMLLGIVIGQNVPPHQVFNFFLINFKNTPIDPEWPKSTIIQRKNSFFLVITY